MFDRLHREDKGLKPLVSNHAQGTTPYRQDLLLGLRGILALLVVISHYRGYADVYREGLLVYLSSSGSYPVFLFFALSGYLMCKILDTRYQDAVGRFYFNRITRIIPVYYFALAFTVLVAGLAQIRGSELLSATFFVGNYNGLATFPNRPVWSLSTEMQFYLLAPLLFKFIRVRDFRKLVTLFIGVLTFNLILRAAYQVIFRDTPRFYDTFFYTDLSINLVYFLAGWLAYLARDYLPKVRPFAAVGAILTMLVIFWVLHVHYIPDDTIYFSRLWFYVLPTVMAVVAFIFLPSLDRYASSGNKPVERAVFFLGITSYSAYVLHVPFLRLIEKLNLGILTPLVALPLLYAFCYLVYRVIEKPAFRFRLRAAPQVQTS